MYKIQREKRVKEKERIGSKIYWIPAFAGMGSESAG